MHETLQQLVSFFSFLAEARRFELLVRLLARQFSKLLVSATHPNFHLVVPKQFFVKSIAKLQVLFETAKPQPNFFELYRPPVGKTRSPQCTNAKLQYPSPQKHIQLTVSDSRKAIRKAALSNFRNNLPCAFQYEEAGFLGHFLWFK